MLKKYCACIGICFLSLCGLLSCGLENFPYIDSVPQGDYMDITRATVNLPSSSADGYSSFFTYFVIFYRIYASNELRQGKIDNDTLREEINRTLNSDFLRLEPYTDITSTTVSTANLENTFLNQRYFKLELEGGDDITRVLGRGALGKTLEIVFSTINGESPTLRLLGDGNTYTLQRANKAPGFPDFSPQPDDADLFLTFLNHPKLYDTANATSAINADVVAASSSPGRYTYVSMYIAAVGIYPEDTPPSTIYSQPTFLGIFKLAEWS